MFSCKNSTKAILDKKAMIFGEKGYIEIPEYWKARSAVVHRSGEEPKTIAYPCDHELIYEAQHIAQCFAEGRLTSPVVTEELSVKGIKALERVKSTW